MNQSRCRELVKWPQLILFGLLLSCLMVACGRGTYAGGSYDEYSDEYRFEMNPKLEEAQARIEELEGELEEVKAQLETTQTAIREMSEFVECEHCGNEVDLTYIKSELEHGW